MATSIAFALAGLGGFNAHGAGFLTAAKELAVKPDLVTATSGQVVVLGEWLRGSNLEMLLIDPQRSPGFLGYRDDRFLWRSRYIPAGYSRPGILCVSKAECYFLLADLTFRSCQQSPCQ